MTKLYTPLNIGRFELAHRVVFECIVDPTAFAAGLDPSCRLLGQLPAGTLVILPIDCAAVESAEGETWPFRTAAIADFWRSFVEAQRQAGRVVMCRLKRPPIVGSTAFGLGLDRDDAQCVIEQVVGAAKRIQDLNFDGIEFDGADDILVEILRSRDARKLIGRRDDGLGALLSFLVNMTTTLLDVWPAERLGVRMAPFAATDDEAVRAVEETLEVFSDHEIAYVHFGEMLVGTDRVKDVMVSDLALRYRRAFPNVLVAAGNFDLSTATLAVESRWADAVCLPLRADTDDVFAIGEIVRNLAVSR